MTLSTEPKRCQSTFSAHTRASSDVTAPGRSQRQAGSVAFFFAALACGSAPDLGGNGDPFAAQPSPSLTDDAGSGGAVPVERIDRAAGGAHPDGGVNTGGAQLSGGASISIDAAQPQGSGGARAVGAGGATSAGGASSCVPLGSNPLLWCMGKCGPQRDGCGGLVQCAACPADCAPACPGPCPVDQASGLRQTICCATVNSSNRCGCLQPDGFCQGAP